MYSVFPFVFYPPPLPTIGSKKSEDSMSFVVMLLNSTFFFQRKNVIRLNRFLS